VVVGKPRYVKKSNNAAKCKYAGDSSHLHVFTSRYIGEFIHHYLLTSTLKLQKKYEELVREVEGFENRAFTKGLA
jgi:hypothetical protein